MLSRPVASLPILLSLGALLWLATAPCAHALELNEHPWHAPAGCPNQNAAEAQLRELTGDASLLRRGRARVYIETAASGELRARVSIVRGNMVERRVLYGRACDALAEAALLVIGLAYDADDERDPAQTRDRDPTRRAGLKTQLALAPLLQLDAGSLPGSTLGVGGSLLLRQRRLRGELDGTYFLARSTELSADSRAGDFRLTTFTLRGCYALSGPAIGRGRWPTIAPCVAIELGRTGGNGRGLMDMRDRHAIWGATLVGLTLALAPYGRVCPAASLEAGFPFLRPSFDAEGFGSVFQARVAVLRASVKIAFDVL